MGLFGNIIGIAIDTVTLPVDIAKDAGNTLLGDPTDNTKEKLEKLNDNLREL